MVMAPGPNDHGSVTARRGHSSVTARSQLSHGEVTAQSRHLQYDHGSVTARSQLNHGPGHGSVTAGCDHFGHRELTVSNFFLMGLYVPLYASNTVVKRDYENGCPHGLLFINKDLKCGEVLMPMTPFLESRALSKFKHESTGQSSPCVCVCAFAWFTRLITHFWGAMLVYLSSSVFIIFPIFPATIFRVSVSSCVNYSSYSWWLIISFVVLHSLSRCLCVSSSS